MYTCSSVKKTLGSCYINVNKEGMLDLEQLRSSIRKDTILVSIMHINNEVGFINPIDEVVNIVKACNPLTKIHVDMVQSIGKVPIDLSRIDLASFSAHKIYGLKGSGFFLIKKKHITPLPLGGKNNFITSRNEKCS